MANYIKYSTNAQTRALKMGNFWLGPVNDGKGPTSSTGYYTALNPPSGGFTIYANKASNGPAIYQATNESQLVSITNQIGGTSFTTSAQCLTWYVTQTDKFCVNREYEGIITDGLVLNLDAGFTPSYPTSGTTMYNLSTNGFNGTLTNGPTFSGGNGGIIILDGTDDYINVGNIGDYSTISYTLEAFVYPEFDFGLYGRSFFNKNSSCTSAEFGFEYGRFTNKFTFITRDDLTLISTSTYPKNNWYHAVITRTNNGNSTYTNKLYVNSVLDNTTTVNYAPVDSNGLFGIGVGINCGVGYFTGKLGTSRIYNKALSSVEVLQNYNAQKSRFGL